MKWKYHIPHVWERERQVWEDIYLMPLDKNWKEGSIHLTIDALGNIENPEHGDEREEFQKEFKEKLEEENYYISGADMIVNSEDFNKKELIDWVIVWLKEQNLPVSELIEAPIEDFAETNEHAKMVSELKKLI
ncbi:MAG: hypothetical protein PVH36_05175 [Desulfobacterales bacterium]|jgi:hypothetical protein